MKRLGASGQSPTDSLNVAKCLVAPEGVGFKVPLGEMEGTTCHLEAQVSQEGRAGFGPQASHGCCPSSWVGRSAVPWHRKGWPSAQFSGSGRNARSSG